MTMKLYEVTRKFTDGTLVGMTHTEVISVKVDVGFRCDKPIGGSPYVIIACNEVESCK